MVVEGCKPNGRTASTNTCYQPVQIKIATQQTPQSLTSSSSASSLPAIEGQQVQTCNCCPYGYHIDRDFVRFCESYRTPDGQIYQRTVKSRLVMPWDPPVDNCDPPGCEQEEQEDAAIEIDGEIAYMHVERVVTESLENSDKLAEYYQWSPEVSLPVVQKFRTVHESRQEEEKVVNMHHTEHATYEMKAPEPPTPPAVETCCIGVETDDVYLRNAGCQAEIIIEVPKRDACTSVCVAQRNTGMLACVPLRSTGFGCNDVNSKLYQDPPEMRSRACGDGAPRQRDFCFGNNRVDRLPYVDPEMRSIGCNYDCDAPWIKKHSVASCMAGPSFFRGMLDRGIQADLLPKPPRMCTTWTQFDKRWATSDACIGNYGPDVTSMGIQVQPEVSSRTTPNPWCDIRPVTYEACVEAAIEPDFIETETCETNFANSFETILRAIYQHQIVNKEEVLEWLQEALTKDVKTAECQVDPRELECWDSSLNDDSDNRHPIKVDTIACQTLQSGPEIPRSNVSSSTLKNHATQVRPRTCETGSWTDRAVTISTSTTTEGIDKCHKQTATQPAITYTVGTSTESRDEGVEFRHVVSSRPKSPENQRKTVVMTSSTSSSDSNLRSDSRQDRPTRCHVVTIPVTSMSPEPVPQPPPARPLPQLSPAPPRPKKKDTVKVDIDARIRQFERQISATKKYDPAEHDAIGETRRATSMPPTGSEEDLPRSHRARPESRPSRPNLHTEIIGIKPAGRDIGFLDSAIRYRSSSTHLPSRPLKSCLKKSYSELLGPQPSDQQLQRGGLSSWGSSAELADFQQSPSRKISFSDRVQETTVSPALTDDDDEVSSCSSDRRRRALMSDSDSSIDEASYQTQPRPRSDSTYSLPPIVLTSCEQYSECLRGRAKLHQGELEQVLATIGGCWFAATQKMADPYQVEDYMREFRRIDPLLLEKVAVICDDTGNTALHYAVSQANFEVIRLLLDVPNVERNVDVLNRAGYSALMLASLAEPQTAQQREILIRLFRAGNVDARSAQALQTALMLSSAHGRLAVVDLLLACGADPNAQDADGSTALMTAAEHGYIDVVRRLLADPRTDPYLVDIEGCNALQVAINSSSDEVAKLLEDEMNASKSESKGSFQAEEAPPGAVIIPVIRTNKSSAPAQPIARPSPRSESPPIEHPQIPPPSTRIQPRSPMRHATTSGIVTPRYGRRAKTSTYVTTESTSC